MDRLHCAVQRLALAGMALLLTSRWRAPHEDTISSPVWRAFVLAGIVMAVAAFIRPNRTVVAALCATAMMLFLVRSLAFVSTGPGFWRNLGCALMMPGVAWLFRHDTR